MKEVPSNSLRELVKDAIDKSMYVTAGFIAEQLTRSPAAQMSDLITFAKCFYLQNQPRRCLAALEQRGLLSAHNTQLLSEMLLTASLSPVSMGFLGKDESSICSGSNFADLVSAFQLAARCLFSLEEYEDCVTLLGPLVALDYDNERDSEDNLFTNCEAAVTRAKNLFKLGNESGEKGNNIDTTSSSSGATSSIIMEINPMSGIYNTIGQCYDQLDNRPRAIKSLIAALSIDSACTEAAEYLVTHGLLSIQERRTLVKDKLDLSNGRSWLEGYYMFTLLGESHVVDPASTSATAAAAVNNSSPPASKSNHSINQTTTSIQCLWEPSTAEWMARNAEQLYDRMQPEQAYRLARQAYTQDPFDPRSLLIYIACLLELKMKTELFYLGHELSRTYPKIAVSWYAVGCYYLCCKKYEAAQKHLQRATKIDKRFAKAWVALGQSLSAQEESEHAIAAYRAACRLIPGDHRPMVLMAKELVRTNYLSLALHLLAGALQIIPKDPVVHNEIGVIYMRLDRLQEALSHFSHAVTAVDCSSNNVNINSSKDGNSCVRISKEIYSNYATALRKNNQLNDALIWYNHCLSLSPNDSNTHASIGFTLHLLKKFDNAIDSYHRALALQPTFTFCIDMLNKAMNDSCNTMSIGGTDFENRTFSSKSSALSAVFMDCMKNEENDENHDGVSIMLGGTDSLSFLRSV